MCLSRSNTGREIQRSKFSRQSMNVFKNSAVCRTQICRHVAFRSTENGNKFTFRSFVFFKYRMMDKVHKPSKPENKIIFLLMSYGKKYRFLYESANTRYKNKQNWRNSDFNFGDVFSSTVKKLFCRRNLSFKIRLWWIYQLRWSEICIKVKEITGFDVLVAVKWIIIWNMSQNNCL